MKTSQLQTLVAAINHAIPSNDGLTFQLEWIGCRPRLIHADRHGNGSPISPRQSKAKMFDWLQTFIAGMNAVTPGRVFTVFPKEQS